MASWQPGLQLSPPSGFDALADGVGSLAAAAGTVLDATGAALDAAKLFLTGVAAPQAAAASALVAGAQDLVNDLFGTGAFTIAVHPWTPGVGRGEGAWRHLDFPRLVQALAESFDDASDRARPQFSGAADVEMIVVAAGAASPTAFAGLLEALEALLGTREFALAARRVRQALALEREQYAAPVGSRPPDWRSVTVREAFPGLAPVEAALQENLALLEGYAAAGETAVDAAADLIAAKQAQLATLQSRLDDAAALLAGGISGTGVYKLAVAGTGGTALLRNELLSATDAPGPELSFCAGVALVGGAGSLAAIREVMAL